MTLRNYFFEGVHCLDEIATRLVRVDGHQKDWSAGSFSPIIPIETSK
jgi:hypothetical protein